MQETQQRLFRKVFTDPGYSVRRYYVDDFFSRAIDAFEEGADILDMGGKKNNKRGEFNIENYRLNVTYANLDETTHPDYLCDIANIPVGDNSFDAVILAEVLEHVPEPKLVLEEAFRVLKPGGKALICAPFMFHVHADPYDFARYTDHWYKTVLQNIGFRNLTIEKQGLFFSVLANMLKLWAYERKISAKSKWEKRIIRRMTSWTVRKALEWDRQQYYRSHKIFSNHTTGYGIFCEK